MAKLKIKPITSKPKGQAQSKHLSDFITVFEKSAKTAANKTMQQIARDLFLEVKRAIRNQAYNWEPLNPEYKKRKQRQGLDTRTLIATGFYLENIRYWKDSRGKWHVGVRPRVKHKDSDLPLTALARIHEFGVDRPEKNIVIPARPVWRPALTKVLRSKRRYREMFAKMSRKMMGKAGQ